MKEYEALMSNET
jgi:hypothetical protein